MSNDIPFKFYKIKYSFESDPEEDQAWKYINYIRGVIYEQDEYGKDLKVVGKLEVDIILVSLALENSMDLLSVFDTSQDLLDIGCRIINFETDDLFEEIKEYYGELLFWNNDICIVRSIELLPEYRNKKLGRKIVKDIFNRFNGSCGLFVFVCKPLQFEHNELTKEERDWKEMMKYNSLNSDPETSKYKLLNFFQQCGCNIIPGISDELVFINSISHI